MSAPDFSHGIGEAAEHIYFHMGAWHDFGYETPPAPECKPVPPLGERSAEAIKAGHEAIKAIDELTRQLYRLREQLVSELRQDEDMRADRVDAMIAQRRQERSADDLAPPPGVLPWAMADDKSHWRTELPDGRTAVIRRVLGEDGESSLLFVPAVYESAGDFVTGPECDGLLAAAHWVAEHAEESR